MSPRSWTRPSRSLLKEVHETASTLITTNRPTQDWGIFLGDVPAATAILDRFLAHATIVQVTGKSYRLRQRASTAGD